MGVGIEDLSFLMFGVCVHIGARCGDFDVIYVSGNWVARVGEAQGSSAEMGNLV
jgi:hypothetical protein